MAEAFPGVAAVAARRGVSAYAVALGWLLAQAPNIIPVVGARRPGSIVESATTFAQGLTPAELAEIASGEPAAAAIAGGKGKK